MQLLSGKLETLMTLKNNSLNFHPLKEQIHFQRKPVIAEYKMKIAHRRILDCLTKFLLVVVCPFINGQIRQQWLGYCVVFAFKSVGVCETPVTSC